MSPKKILFLDNDLALIEVTHIIFQEYDFQIIHEESSNHIIEKVDLKRPDVILIDSYISGNGAIYTAHLLKQHPKFNKIPVILMSTNFDIAKIAIAAGVDDYISKPFNIDEFENKILRYINQYLII